MRPRMRPRRGAMYCVHMGGRIRVIRQTLDLHIEVRVLAPQPVGGRRLSGAEGQEKLCGMRRVSDV